MPLSALFVDGAHEAGPPAGVVAGMRPGQIGACFTARGSSEALRILSCHPIDVIVVDLDEESSGDLLSELNRDERYQALPVVGMSWQSRPERVEQLLRSGMEAFVAKPVQSEVLRRELRQICGVVPAMRWEE
jgi:CheY-like chemotaxis protein